MILRTASRPVQLAVAAGVVLLSARGGAAGVDFSHDIAPVLREHCGACHTGDKKKGGLSMNSRADLMAGGEGGKVVESGNSAGSLLIKAITSKDPEAQMPPPDAKQPRVPAEKVALLRAWIDGGVKWEDGFTFRKPAYEPPLKPRRPELPPVVAGRTNPIDRILDAYLAQHGRPRTEALDDAAFARRVHLDLIGLLPEPEALARFLADTAPDRRARLVRELLGRETDYAEHWLTFWNDLLRNDYSRVGFGPGTGAPVTRWLYDALLTNMPYDRFVRELIAPPTPESAGFSAGLAWRGTINASQAREVQFAQSISQSFLGINMKCASCHDSFIDRWKLTDAYGLAAIYAGAPMVIHRCDKTTEKKAEPAWIFPELGQVKADAPQPERLRQLAALMTHPENGRFTRTIVNRLWHRLMGRGIVHPVDAMQAEPWSADLLDFLASRFAEDGHDLKKTLELICTSQAYQSRAVMRRKDDNAAPFTFAGPRAKRMTAEQFIDAVWQITGGNPAAADAPVLRGKPDPALVKSTRLGAKWIREGAMPEEKADAAGEAEIAPDPKPAAANAKPGPPAVPAKKPRTKNVLRKMFTLAEAPAGAFGVIGRDAGGLQCFVNGAALSNDRGLIRTRGVIAVVMRGNLKKGENEIVLVMDKPAANQPEQGAFFEVQARFADGTVQAIGTDASWEWSPELPDAKGKVTGAEIRNAKWLPVEIMPDAPDQEQLRTRMAGALVHVATPPPPVRAGLMKCDLLQRALGRPNREQIVSTRPEDLTTLEALDLANGDALSGLLAAGAKRILARKWDSPDALATWLYTFAVSRPPVSEELELARQLTGDKPAEQGVQDLLWAICMLPEFQLIR